jgi:Caspase domain
VSLPDPKHSRAILIGTSHYRDPYLPDLPAVANNLVDLASALTGRGGVLSPSVCTVLREPSDVPSLGRQLRRLAAEASDLLLVYYAGHGLIGSDSHELYLALQGSQHDDPFYSALPFDGIRRAMRDSPARTRVLILDCCFSGRAIEDVMAEPSSAFLGQLEVAGTFLLTATPANVVAMAPVGARNTAFTGALLAAFRDGIPDGPEFLTLDDLYRATLRTAQVTGLPKPQRRGTATADQLVLARNPYSAARGPAVRSAVVQSSWEGQTLPSMSRHRPRGGPQRNMGVEHVTFHQYRVLYVIAAVLSALLATVLAFLPFTESSTLARLLWVGLVVLALFFSYVFAKFARFPISLDIGARGIELFHRRGWVWLPWSTIERVEVVRYQGHSLIVSWFKDSDDFPDFDTLGGGPHFVPKLGGAVLCSVGVLHAPRQEIVRAIRYFSQYRTD